MNKKNLVLFLATLLLIGTGYAEDSNTLAIPADTTTLSTSAAKTNLDNLITESAAFRTEKSKIGSFTDIETNAQKLTPPYSDGDITKACSSIDRNNTFGAATYWLCINSLKGLSQSAVNMNQNTNNSIVLAIKELSYNTLYLATKFLFAVEDIFSSTHDKYVPQFNAIYKDNLAGFNAEIKAGLVDSLQQSQAASSNSKATLTEDLNKNTLDPNEFINTPSYTADQQKNADLIKKLLMYYPPLPKEIALTPYSYNKQIYLLLKNFNKTPAENAFYPVNEKDLPDFTKHFTNLQEFQDYQIQRSSIILSRLLYFSSILQSYTARTKEDGIVATEYKMAMEPMKPEYYDKMKTATLPSVVVEILHSINNNVYFMYQLHRDNERIIFMQAMSGMLMSSISDMMLGNKADEILKKMSDYYCTKGNYNTNLELCPKPMPGT